MSRSSIARPVETSVETSFVQASCTQARSMNKWVSVALLTNGGYIRLWCQSVHVKLMSVTDEAEPPPTTQGRSMQTTEWGDCGMKSPLEQKKNASHIIIGVVVVDFVRLEAS